MSPWVWILTGLGSFLTLSLLVALVVGAIFGVISRAVSELHEFELWVAKGPHRAAASEQPGEAVSQEKRVAAL